MKTFAVLLVLSLACTGQAKMLYGQGIFIVKSPSEVLCKAFELPPGSFSKPPHVQLSLFMNETMNTYEAAVNWVEQVNVTGFTACITAAGPIAGNRTIVLQWMAYDAVLNGMFSEQAVTIWTASSRCEEIDFYSYGNVLESFKDAVPHVYVTAIHSKIRQKRDAMSVWAEQVTKSGFKICLRELKNFDGVHKEIYVDWLAMASAPSGWIVGREGALQFPNDEKLTLNTRYSFCKDESFPERFYSAPVMITTARHFSSNEKSIAPKNNAITEWIEKVDINGFTVCLKDIQPLSGPHDPITIDYLAIGHLDPCLKVKCEFYGFCVADGPQSPRCECPADCSYDEPLCGSDGVTYRNPCAWKKAICQSKTYINITHPGACYPFILHHGRVSLDLSKDEVVCQLVVYNQQKEKFSPYYTVHVQVSVNYYSSSYNNFVHDAAVAWAELININNFTVCALKAGRNDRLTPDDGQTFVDYMAYQGAPAKAIAGEITVNSWWEGTKCTTVDLPSDKFSAPPNALVSSEHMVDGIVHDAATIWVEGISSKSFQVCLREMQNFDGLHEKIHVNWIAYDTLPPEMKAERISLSFPNTKLPSELDNFAYCQSGLFSGNYTSIPTMIATAKHSAGNLLPAFNSISVWIEQISLNGFKVCLKELHTTNGYDPVDVTLLAIGS